jgi:long-chain acyl-CoA synthetase
MKLKLVMMPRWEPESALRLIERERVTTLVGVPTQSWDLIEYPAFSRYDTTSLSSIVGGGAPAPEKLVKRVEGSFSSGRPAIGYGMTETNAYGPSNQGDDYLRRPSSTGHARTPIMDVEIRDEAGRPLATGERGEIWMRSPVLITGYWKNPVATAETIVEGWLRSGDIGRIDADGLLYVDDRANDMVLRAGENVYAAEVESAIYELPEVYEAAVFGVADERLGEEVACVVRLKAGEAMSGDALREALTTSLAAFKIPSLVAFSEEPLPRNPAGKVLKRALRERYFLA